MPSPVAHALAGCIVYQAWPYVRGGRDTVLLASCAALAVAPDVDFFPGVLMGEPWRFHPSATHTLGGVILVGLCCALLLRKLRSDDILRIGVLIAAYASHLCLDFFNADHRAPIGLALLWPISDARFLSPVAFFPGLHSNLATSGGGWFLAIAASRNWGIVAREVLLLLPMLVGARILARTRISAGKQENAS